MNVQPCLYTKLFITSAAASLPVGPASQDMLPGAARCCRMLPSDRQPVALRPMEPAEVLKHTASSLHCWPFMAVLVLVSGGAPGHLQSFRSDASVCFPGAVCAKDQRCFAESVVDHMCEMQEMRFVSRQRNLLSRPARRSRPSSPECHYCADLFCHYLILQYSTHRVSPSG